MGHAPAWPPTWEHAARWGSYDEDEANRVRETVQTIIDRKGRHENPERRIPNALGQRSQEMQAIRKINT